MKQFILILVLIISLFQSAYLLAEGPLILGIRGNEEATDKFAAKNSLTVVPSKTREFDNGNTFVQIAGSVVHQDVILLLPKEMTANQLMEALIKVRTARTDGARNIIVKSPIKLSNVRLPELQKHPKDFLEHLFRNAGIDSIKEANRPLRNPFHLTTHYNRVGEEGKPVIASQAESDFATTVSQQTNIPLAKKLTKLPDHAPVYFVADTTQPVNKNLFNLMITVGNLTRAGHAVHLIERYLPYARSDKKDQTGVTITGRLVADLINEAGTASAMFVRAHAPQSQGFFSIPTFQLTSRPTITNYLKELEVEVVIAPDAGAQKETTLFADKMNLPVGVANKQRDADGNSSLRDISGPDVKGKRAVIIDDETATGGTLAKVAELLHKLGAAEVYAVVTHITGSAAAAIDSPYLKQIIVTDTIPSNFSNPKVKVLSMSKEVSDQILEIERHRNAWEEGECRLLHKILGKKL